MKQYGVRLRQDDDMSWPEFCSLLSGIMPDTPLGAVIEIRAEKDRKKIARFTKEQKRIRQEWLKRRAAENKDKGVNIWTNFQCAAKEAYEKK